MKCCHSNFLIQNISVSAIFTLTDIVAISCNPKDITHFLVDLLVGVLD